MPQGYVFSPDQISAMASYFNTKSRANAALGAAEMARANTPSPAASAASGGAASGVAAAPTSQPSNWSWLDLLSPLAVGIEAVGSATNAIWNSMQNGKPWWEVVGTGATGFGLGATDAILRAFNADEPLLDAAHNWNPELTGDNHRQAMYLSTAVGQHTDNFKFISDWVDSWAPGKVGTVDPTFQRPASTGFPGANADSAPTPIAEGFPERMAEASKGAFGLTLDIVADPTTYLSFGIGPSLRGAGAGVRAATEAGVKAAAETNSVASAVKAGSAAFKPAWQAARDAAAAVKANQRAARDAARAGAEDTVKPTTSAPAATATDRNAMHPAATQEGFDLDALLLEGSASAMRQQADDFARLSEDAATPGALRTGDSITEGVDVGMGRMLDDIARNDARAGRRADEALAGLEDVRQTIGAAQKVPSKKILQASRETGKLSTATQTALRDALYSARPGQTRAALEAIESADPQVTKILDTDISDMVGSATPITVREAIEQVRPRGGGNELSSAHSALADAVEAAISAGGKTTAISADALRAAIKAAVPGAKRITQAKIDRVVMAQNNSERMTLLNEMLSPFMGRELTYKSVGAMMRGLMVDTAAEAEAMRRTLKTLGFYREATAKDVAKLRDSVINKAKPRYDELVNAVESREEILVAYGIDNETYAAALALTRTPDGQQMIADYRAVEARLAASEREARRASNQAVREAQRAAGAAVKPGERINVAAPKGIKVTATESGGVTTGTSTAPGREVQDIQGVVAADVYEAMKHAPNSGPVRKSYAALEQTIIEQYRQMKADGITIEFRQGVEGPNPYPDSAAVMRDIEENSNLIVQADAGATLPKDHPMNKMVEVDGEQIHLNDLFRGVHDYWGHYKAGEAGRVISFGPSGEYDAWLTHRETLPEGSWMALWDETRGQNTWTNYYGNHSSLPVADREFAVQKAGVVPREVYAADPDEFAAGVSTVQRRRAEPAAPATRAPQEDLRLTERQIEALNYTPEELADMGYSATAAERAAKGEVAPEPKPTAEAPTGRTPGALPAVQRVRNIEADQAAGERLLGGYGAPDAAGEIAIGAGKAKGREVSPTGGALAAGAEALGRELRSAADAAIKAGRAEQDFFGVVLQGGRLAKIVNRVIKAMGDRGAASGLSGAERAAYMANSYRAAIHGVESWMRQLGIFPAQPGKTGPLFAVSWGQMVSAMSDKALPVLLGLRGQFGAKMAKGADEFKSGFSIYPNAIYPAVQDAVGMFRRGASADEIAVAAEARMRNTMKGISRDAEKNIPAEDWGLMAREVSDPEFLRAIDEIDNGQLAALTREHYEAGRAAVLPVMAQMREIVRTGGAGDARLFGLFTRGYDDAIRTTLGDAGVPTLASKIASQSMDAAFLKGFIGPNEVADFGMRKTISDLHRDLVGKQIAEAAPEDVAAMRAFVAGRKGRTYNYEKWRNGVTAAVARHYDATLDESAAEIAREAMDHAAAYEAKVVELEAQGLKPPTSLIDDLEETYVNLSAMALTQGEKTSGIVAGLGRAAMNLMTKLDPWAFQSTVRDFATGARMNAHSIMDLGERGLDVLIGGKKGYEGIRQALGRQLGRKATREDVNAFLVKAIKTNAYVRHLFPDGVTDDFFEAFATGRMSIAPRAGHMDTAGNYAEHELLAIDPEMMQHALAVGRLIDRYLDPAVITQMAITQRDIARVAERVGLPKGFAEAGESVAERMVIWQRFAESEDPIRAMVGYQRAIAQATVRPRVAGELAAQFGDTFKREANWVRIDPRSGTLAAHLGETYFPPEIANELKYLQKFLDDMEKAPSAWGRTVMPVLDFIVNMYRSSLTIWNPRHHIANIIGEVAINMIHGVNPARSILSNRLLAHVGMADARTVDELIGKIKPESELGSIDPAMLGHTLTASIGGKRVELSMDELVRFLREDGILMTGRIERQVEDLMIDSRIAKALSAFSNSKYNLVARANRGLSRVSAWRDNQTRVAHWLEEMARGGDNLLKARSRAREIVHRTHPTPASLATFEYKALRKVFTFYTWQKMLAGEVMRMAIERPGVVLLPMKFAYARAEANGITSLSYFEPFPADPEQRGRIASYYMNGAYGPQITGGDVPDILGLMLGYSSEPTDGELANLWGMSLNAPQLDSLSGLFQNVNLAADPFSALAAPIAAANPVLKQAIETAFNHQVVGSSQEIRGADDPWGDQLGYMFSQTGVPFAMAYMAGWNGSRYTDINKEYDTPELMQGELVRRALNWWTGLKVTNYTNPTSTRFAAQEVSSQMTLDLRGLGYSDEQISTIKRYYSAYTKAGNKIDVQTYLDQIGFAPPAGR